MIKKESIITKTNGTFCMSAIKDTYIPYKNNVPELPKKYLHAGVLNYKKVLGLLKGGKALSSRQGKLRERLYIMHCCQSIRAEKHPQTGAPTEVSGVTCLHASLLLVILAGVTHMLSVHLCYARQALSRCAGQEVNKNQSWSRELETSLSWQKVRSRSTLLYFPAF